jgi:hypothetical protein
MPLMTLREIAIANGVESQFGSYRFRKSLADELISRGMIVRRIKIPGKDLGFGRYYYGFPAEFEPYLVDMKSIVIPPDQGTSE